MQEITIDTCGFSCPQPVLMVHPHIKQKNVQRIIVLVDNDASLENVSRAAKTHGWNVQTENAQNGIHTLTLTPCAS